MSAPRLPTLRLPGGEGVWVTDLTKPPLSGAPPSGTTGAPAGPMRTVGRSFQLQAGVPFQLVAANNARSGLLIQNRDPVVELFFAFGQPADASSASLGPGAPGGSVLLDVVCPTDAVWVFATAAAAGYFAEFARGW